jgi:Carboxypeptidase regulatory-like domain
MEAVRAKLTIGVAMLLATALVCAGVQSEGALRTVTGHVVSAHGQPLLKAVVHLKNTRTLAIKTYITEADGAYRFTALSPSVDYEIYAEYEGARSDTKTLSAFDNRKQATINLKVKTSQ